MSSPGNRGPFLAVLLVSLAVGAGCRNSCQRVCVRMADYAEECGFTLAESELPDCIVQQGDSTPEDLKSCRSFGDAATLRQEWTCEDLDIYWGAAPPAEEPT